MKIASRKKLFVMTVTRRTRVFVMYSRGVFPPLQTLAVEAVVAQSGEDAIN